MITHSLISAPLAKTFSFALDNARQLPPEYARTRANTQCVRTPHRLTGKPAHNAKMKKNYGPTQDSGLPTHDRDANAALQHSFIRSHSRNRFYRSSASLPRCCALKSSLDSFQWRRMKKNYVRTCSPFPILFLPVLLHSQFAFRFFFFLPRSHGCCWFLPSLYVYSSTEFICLSHWTNWLTDWLLVLQCIFSVLR